MTARLRWPTPLADVPGFPADLLAPLAAYNLATVGDLVAKVKRLNPGLLPPRTAIGLLIRGTPPIDNPETVRRGAEALASFLGYGEHERPADWSDPPKSAAAGEPSHGCEAGRRSPQARKHMDPGVNPIRLISPSMLSLHPQADLVPEMSAEEFEEFAADVKKHGVQQPLELIPGTTTIIDGRTRFKAAKLADLAAVPVRDADLAGESPVAHMLRVAIHRRHLTTGQRAMLALELEKEFVGEAKERKRAGGARGGAASAEARKHPFPPTELPATVPEPAPARRDRRNESRAKAAAAAGVSPRTVSTAKRVAKKAPELAAKVKAGAMKLAHAAAQVPPGKPPKMAPPSPPASPPAPVVFSACPFCGAGSKALNQIVGPVSYVECLKCFSRGPTSNLGAKESAREKWNRRAAT